MAYLVIFNAQNNPLVIGYISKNSQEPNGVKLDDFLGGFKEATEGTSLAMAVNENLEKFAPEKTSMRNAVAYKVTPNEHIDFTDCTYGPNSYPLYFQPRLPGF